MNYCLDGHRNFIIISCFVNIDTHILCNRHYKHFQYNTCIYISACKHRYACAHTHVCIQCKKIDNKTVWMEIDDIRLKWARVLAKTVHNKTNPMVSLFVIECFIQYQYDICWRFTFLWRLSVSHCSLLTLLSVCACLYNNRYSTNWSRNDNIAMHAISKHKYLKDAKNNIVFIRIHAYIEKGLCVTKTNQSNCMCVCVCV